MIQFKDYSKREFEYKVRKTLEFLEENGMDATVGHIMNVADDFLGSLWELHRHWVKQMTINEDVKIDYIKNILQEEIADGRVIIKEEDEEYLARRIHSKICHSSKNK